MQEINLLSIFKISDNIITKAVEDELVIITTKDEISDIDSSIYTLNPTGKVVWDKLDGKLSLEEIIRQLTEEYNAPDGAVEADVRKLISELLEKSLIHEA